MNEWQHLEGSCLIHFPEKFTMAMWFMRNDIARFPHETHSAEPCLDLAMAVHFVTDNSFYVGCDRDAMDQFF